MLTRSWTWLAGCLMGTVSGRPKHAAAHLSAGICRIKWVCAPAIPLWLIGWRGHLEYLVRGGFLPMGGVILPGDPVSGAKALIAFSFLIGIVSCLYILLKPGKHLSLSQARFSVVVVSLGILLCESLHVGFTFGQQALHYTSYSLALLLGMISATIRARRSDGGIDVRAARAFS